jgi:TetR/AcrR family fatty acid metabolism transcriptional regulator
MNDDSSQSPKDRRRERTRKEILRAAAQVFTQKGFHEATIQEIAQLAEFSAGSLYNYFENKEALYHDLFEDVFEAFERILVLPGGDAPLPERLRLLVRGLFQFADDHRDHFRFFALLQWSGGLSLGKDMGARSACQRELMHAYLRGFFDDAVARGELAGCDTDSCAVMLGGTLMANAVNTFHQHGASRLVDRTEAVVALVLDGVRGRRS